MHTRMQAVEVLHPAVRILTLPPIVIGVTLLLMYALEGFLTLRELLVCELFLLLIPIAAYPLREILHIGKGSAVRRHNGGRKSCNGLKKHKNQRGKILDSDLPPAAEQLVQ